MPKKRRCAAGFSHSDSSTTRHWPNGAPPGDVRDVPSTLTSSALRYHSSRNESLIWPQSIRRCCKTLSFGLTKRLWRSFVGSVRGTANRVIRATKATVATVHSLTLKLPRFASWMVRTGSGSVNLATSNCAITVRFREYPKPLPLFGIRQANGTSASVARCPTHK